MLPLVIAGGTATLGSMFLNKGAQNSVDEARSAVISAERARQAAFDAEAAKLNDQARDRYVNFDTQQADTARSLADLYKTPITTPNTQYTAAPLPPTASGIVGREINNKNTIAQNYVDHQGDTLAELRSFGDLMGRIGLGQARDAQSIGQIGSFKKGSAQVQNLELEDANRAGNDMKLWADIAGGLGKVGLTAGLSGVMAPAAAVTGSASALPAAFAGADWQAPNVAAPWAAPAFRPPPASMFSTGSTPFLTYGR